MQFLPCLPLILKRKISYLQSRVGKIAKHQKVSINVYHFSSARVFSNTFFLHYLTFLGQKDISLLFVCHDHKLFVNYMQALLEKTQQLSTVLPHRA